MDIFFQDPHEIPLPPDEVRIRELRAELLPDGQRVRIYFELDPFQKRPSAELAISDANGVPLAHASVIESMVRKIELTMHLRTPGAPFPYRLAASIYYLAPLPEAGRELDPADTAPPQVIDRKTIQFTNE